GRILAAAPGLVKGKISRCGAFAETINILLPFQAIRDKKILCRITICRPLFEMPFYLSLQVLS
ncbi:hypothetical protein, partial [Cedecea neteri]|uniref:hypothetical protein n=1 Tax=Cedecea neteri TaxID=158822 RepID=UPI001C3F1CD9